MSSTKHARILEINTADDGSQSGEEGSAVIEFLALGTLLLVPTVWFLLAVAQIQAASYAAVGAADQAAKMYTASGASEHSRTEHSEAAAAAALEDFDIPADHASVRRQCSGSCDDEGSVVTYHVDVRVPLPWVPEFAGWEHRVVTVEASSAQVQGQRDGQGQ